MFNGFLRDLMYGARTLRKRPIFTFCAALSLAIGIGANTAVFSIISSVLFRPLPVAAPGRLVVLIGQHSNSNTPRGISFPDYLYYRQHMSSTESMAVSVSSNVNFNDGDQAQRMRLEMVSSNYFSFLGVPAFMGHNFTAEDMEEKKQQAVVVLSYNFWKTKLGADPSIIGKSIRINSHPLIIIGITPGEFVGEQPLMPGDGFVPVSMAGVLFPENRDLLDNRAKEPFRIMARLGAGQKIKNVQSELDLHSTQLATWYPRTNKGIHVRAIAESKSRPDPELGAYIPWIALIFLFISALVLVIACVNVGSLMLTRFVERQPEIAIRTAIGASTFNVARLIVSEMLLLSTLGGILAWILAIWAISLLAGLQVDSGIPLKIGATMDWRVALFANSMVLLSTLACAFPALRNLGKRPSVQLRENQTAGSGNLTFRMFLMTGQIAVCLVVLICGILFLQSWKNSRKIDLGFSPANLNLFSVDTQSQGYDRQRSRHFVEQSLAGIRNLPGVQSATASAYVPLSFQKGMTSVVPENQSFSEELSERKLDYFYNSVALDYFGTLRIPIKAGRDFTSSDTSEKPRVAIVSEAMAHQLWPNSDPIGKRVKQDEEWVTIIGVAGDVRFDWIYGRPEAHIYFPMSQIPTGIVTFQVRTKDGMDPITDVVRNFLHTMDADLPLFNVETMEKHIEYGPALVPARVGAIFMVTLAGLGVLLAATGVYGIISHLVRGRRREISIRMALGATRFNIITLVISQISRQAAIGIVCGVITSFAITKLFSTLLYGISSTDPLTYIICSLALLLSVAIAAFLPANKSANLDPMLCLRSE